MWDIAQAGWVGRVDRRIGGRILDGALGEAMGPLLVVWVAALIGLTVALVGNTLLGRGRPSVAPMAPVFPLVATLAGAGWLGWRGAEEANADAVVAEGLVWFTGWLAVWPTALCVLVAAAYRGRHGPERRAAWIALGIAMACLLLLAAQASAVPNLPPAVARGVGLLPLVPAVALAARDPNCRAIAASASLTLVVAGEAAGRGITQALMFGSSLTRLEPGVRPLAVARFADAMAPELPWAWAIVGLTTAAALAAALRGPRSALVAPLLGPVALWAATPDPVALAVVAAATSSR